MRFLDWLFGRRLRYKCPVCEGRIWKHFDYGFYQSPPSRRGILMPNSDLCDICYYRILNIQLRREWRAPLKAGEPV